MNPTTIVPTSAFISDQEPEIISPESAAGNQGSEVFKIEREGETLILTPLINLGELAYQQIESGAETIMDLLDRSAVKNVVLNVARIDYFGTTAIGFFLKIWKRVRNQGGHMVFCNLSDHAREILQLTKLDCLWTIFKSKEEALKAVHQ